MSVLHLPALFLLLILSLLFGCAKERPIIVMDTGLDVNYAKSFCEMRSARGTPCPGDPATKVHDFESQVISNFASTPNCQGVVLTVFNVGKIKDQTADSKKASIHANWQLTLDFDMDQTPQEWRLARFVNVDDSAAVQGSPDKLVGSDLATGQGSPNEIAKAACTVAKQDGGRVVK